MYINDTHLILPNQDIDISKYPNYFEESEFLSVSEMKKCPYCSAQLQYDTITCPACGQEIRGRGVGNSVKEFFQAINQEIDEEKKIS